MNQINLNNVKNLQLAWTYKTGEEGEMQTQPIVVNGIFYGVTATMKLFAFDPTKQAKKFGDTNCLGAVATPITYLKNGKQYVAIAAGGGKYGLTRGDTYLAFALPDKN